MLADNLLLYVPCILGDIHHCVKMEIPPLCSIVFGRFLTVTHVDQGWRNTQDNAVVLE